MTPEEMFLKIGKRQTMLNAMGGNMKTKDEIDDALRNVDIEKREFFGMSYEQGVEEALQWVLGEVSDEDFGYAKKD